MRRRRGWVQLTLMGAVFAAIGVLMFTLGRSGAPSLKSMSEGVVFALVGAGCLTCGLREGARRRRVAREERLWRKHLERR